MRLVVTNGTLGTLNQTLLTIHAIRERNLAVAGLVTTGRPARSAASISLTHTPLPPALHSGAPAGPIRWA